MAALLQISIGPVQEFIATARRSRDLWFGSWVLSEVAKAAALAIATNTAVPLDTATDLSSGLIFPAPATLDELQPDSLLNAPNKIVALVHGDPKALACAGRRAALGRLEVIRQQAFATLPKPPKDEYVVNWARAEQQVTDLLEFAWVAVPISTAAEYDTVRTRAEVLLAARKATRTFAPVAWGSHDPKSSLDGQRESVIPEAAFDALDPELLRHFYQIRRGERLCGVGLLKRCGERGGGQDRFFSTSHVAALPLLTRLRTLPAPGSIPAGTTPHDLVKHYIQHLRDDAGVEASVLESVPGKPNGAFQRYDGHLLFEERLSEYISNPEQYQAAVNQLRTLLHALFNGQRPSPYYGLLLADGDFMGSLIESQKTIDRHRKLSQALEQFATDVRQDVENHDGSLVYAGGDDVLAFVPLHTILPCARILAEKFFKALKGFHHAEAENPAPTLSVGIAIVHHLEPLTDALALVRQAEQMAKARPTKNALAVILSKRSGVDRVLVGSWNEQSVLGALDQRLQSLAQFHTKGAIPDGLGYELAQLHQQLYTPDATQAEQLVAPLRLEAIRILKHKRTQNREKLDATISGKLETLLQTATMHEDPASGRLTLAQIAAELTVARDLVTTGVTSD